MQMNSRRSALFKSRQLKTIDNLHTVIMYSVRVYSHMYFTFCQCNENAFQTITEYMKAYILFCSFLKNYASSMYDFFEKLVFTNMEHSCSAQFIDSFRIPYIWYLDAKSYDVFLLKYYFIIFYTASCYKIWNFINSKI